MKYKRGIEKQLYIDLSNGDTAKLMDSIAKLQDDKKLIRKHLKLFMISLISTVYKDAIADRSIIPPPYPKHNKARFLLDSFANPLAIPSLLPNKITAANIPNCHKELIISINYTNNNKSIFNFFMNFKKSSVL